jgi:hypothetical protein
MSGTETIIKYTEPTVFWTEGDTPHLWDSSAALSIRDICKKLSTYLWTSQPVTREHMLVIFFHETGFSNIKQAKNSGPAVGFGQMEIFNDDKIPFFKWLAPGFDSVTFNPKTPPAIQKAKKDKNGILPTMEKLTDGRVLSDDDFAIKMHCKYFEWLFNEGYSKSLPTQKGIKSLDGMLSAQTGGGNEPFIDIFRDGGTNLAAAIKTRKRIDIINALNDIRWYYPDAKGPSKGVETREAKNGRTLVHYPIPLKRFPKYWDFTLPEQDVPFV